MPLSIAKSACFSGLAPLCVQVEVDVVKCQNPSITLVGLPDLAVKESKDRVLTALQNCNWKLDHVRCTINLAPGHLKKEGPFYDLPIALCLLQAMEIFKSPLLDDYLIVGELALSGEVGKIKGALGAALLAKELGCKGILLPAQNAQEASVVDGIDVIGVRHLKEAVKFFRNPTSISPTICELSTKKSKTSIDFSQIHGQKHAKRALEIAAAGGHNVLLCGPPGGGKTMLAKAFVGILPDLSTKEAIEVTHIHSIGGLLKEEEGITFDRPFRTPHHTISYTGMVGGGQIPRPGEISFAHHGVLFLDEFAEFGRKTLEVLRQPLEDGTVTIARAQAGFTFPARFILIAAMNPCPCGFLGHPQKACKDSALEVNRYRQKISGPLLDRIDMHIDVSPVSYKELVETAEEEASEQVKERVEKARILQKKRYNDSELYNAHIDRKTLTSMIPLSSACKQLLKEAIDGMGISARACDRLIKVGRTIADLENSESIEDEHLAEALSYRSLQ